MIQVTDTVGLLSPQEKFELQQVNSNFQVQVVITRIDSQANLRAQMEKCVTSPNKICIGLDPGHRWISSQFGTDTIASTDYAQVNRSGNADFKDQHWVDGFKDIISRANALATSHTRTATPVIIQQPKQVVEKPVPVWPFVAGFGLLGLIGAGLWVILRKQQKRTEAAILDFKSETAELASKNIATMDLDTRGRVTAVNAVSPPITQPLIEQRPPVIVQPSYLRERVVERPVYVPTPVVQAPVQTSLTDVMLTEAVLDEAREAREERREDRWRRERLEREQETERQLARTPTPPPAPTYESSSSSSYDSGSSSSFDSGSSGGGDTSSFDTGSSGGGSDSSF